MSGTCNCNQHVLKLTQQISVMRKELKNLRQKLDAAVFVHKNHLSNIQTALAAQDTKALHFSRKTLEKEVVDTGLSLERGIIRTVPIGYVRSCFPAKRGAPRQPTVCASSRAAIRIERTVFTNPEHALQGLQDYSHVWIIFLFHGNGHLSHKSKVRPPRLNGQRTGLYATRSPHRPNALGLTLAKLDKVTGDTLHLSGIDMIDGTPVLDIKPYISDYDSPQSRCSSGAREFRVSGQCEGTTVSSDDVMEAVAKEADTHTWPDDEKGQEEEKAVLSEEGSGMGAGDARCAVGCFTEGSDLDVLLQEVRSYVSLREDYSQSATEGGSLVLECLKAEHQKDQRWQHKTEVWYGEESYSTIASWVRNPPVTTLAVRFTPNAETDLTEFQPAGQAVPGKPSFQFLRGTEEAVAAIRGVLSADPRSVYRRTSRPDTLFSFTLDTARVTCWFGESFAEVLRVHPFEPAQDHELTETKY